MDGSHRKPYICLSFNFLIQYSANRTCLTSVNMREYETLCPVLLDHYIFVFYSHLCFIPLIHSAQFLRFQHILLTPIFSHAYYHAAVNVFLIPDDAVDRRELGI